MFTKRRSLEHHLDQERIPKEYAAIRSEAIKNDSKCCGVIALALMANITVRKAQNALKRQGRQRNKGTYTHQLLAALNELKVEHRELKTFPKRFKTVRTLERNVSPRANLLVFTSRHVLAVKNGVVQDWTSNRLHRVERVFLIEN